MAIEIWDFFEILFRRRENRMKEKKREREKKTTLKIVACLLWRNLKFSNNEPIFVEKFHTMSKSEEGEGASFN